MECASKGKPSYQASPGQPCPVRLSRASGKVSRKEIANKATQRGEMITCRGRKPREDAEGHANAEPYYYFTMRFRIRVGSPIFENHGRRLRGGSGVLAEGPEIDDVDFSEPTAYPAKAIECA